jgi:hypothetical protein
VVRALSQFFPSSFMILYMAHIVVPFGWGWKTALRPEGNVCCHSSLGWGGVVPVEDVPAGYRVSSPLFVHITP